MCRVNDSSTFFFKFPWPIGVLLDLKRNISHGQKPASHINCLTEALQTCQENVRHKTNLAAFSLVMKMWMAFYSPAVIACLGKLNFMQLHKNIIWFFLSCPYCFKSSKIWVWKHQQFKFLSLKHLLHERILENSHGLTPIYLVKNAFIFHRVKIKEVIRCISFYRFGLWGFLGRKMFLMLDCYQNQAWTVVTKLFLLDNMGFCCCKEVWHYVI